MQYNLLILTRKEAPMSINPTAPSLALAGLALTTVASAGAGLYIGAACFANTRRAYEYVKCTYFGSELITIQDRGHQLFRRADCFSVLDNLIITVLSLIPTLLIAFAVASLLFPPTSIAFAAMLSFSVIGAVGPGIIHAITSSCSGFRYTAVPVLEEERQGTQSIGCIDSPIYVYDSFPIPSFFPWDASSPKRYNDRSFDY